MSSLRVNTITNTAGTGPVEFTNGVSIASGQVISAPNVNLTGIVTASSFDGDGSRITGFVANEITNSKTIAFSLIT
jgi:hypothetical protein